jgi:hypothetical protein
VGEGKRPGFLIVGYFNGGLSGPPPEKQVPRARKKALGMTKLK